MVWFGWLSSVSKLASRVGVEQGEWGTHPPYNYTTWLFVSGKPSVLDFVYKVTGKFNLVLYRLLPVYKNAEKLNLVLYRGPVSPVSKSESHGCLFFSGTPGPTPDCSRGRQVGKKLKIKKHILFPSYEALDADLTLKIRTRQVPIKTIKCMWQNYWIFSLCPRTLLYLTFATYPCHLFSR